MPKARGMAVPQSHSWWAGASHLALAAKGELCVASATTYWYLLSKREMRARTAPRRTARSCEKAVREGSDDVESSEGGRGAVDSCITALVTSEASYLPHMRSVMRRGRAERPGPGYGQG